MPLAPDGIANIDINLWSVERSIALFDFVLNTVAIERLTKSIKQNQKNFVAKTDELSISTFNVRKDLQHAINQTREHLLHSVEHIRKDITVLVDEQEAVVANLKQLELAPEPKEEPAAEVSPSVEPVKVKSLKSLSLSAERCSE